MRHDVFWFLFWSYYKWNCHDSGISPYDHNLLNSWRKNYIIMTCKVVYSKETEWDAPWITENSWMESCSTRRFEAETFWGPAEVTNPDPDYHFKAVTDALKLAKEKLPKAGSVSWKCCQSSYRSEIQQFWHIGVSEMIYVVKDSPLCFYIEEQL